MASMIRVGQSFTDHTECQNAIKTYLTEHNLSFRAKRSEPKNVNYVCSTNLKQNTDPSTCQFYVKAGPDRDGFTIKKIRPHTYPHSTHDSWPTAANSRLWAERYLEAYKINNDIKAKEVRTRERVNYGNKISQRASYRILRKVKLKIQGDEADDFRQLPALERRLKEINDHNYIDLEFFRFGLPITRGRGTKQRTQNVKKGTFKRFFIAPA